MARNGTTHVEITFDDGEVVHEKHRNTWGGWVNMVRRLEQRFGGRFRPVGDDARSFTLGERSGTIQDVNVL